MPTKVLLGAAFVAFLVAGCASNETPGLKAESDDRDPAAVVREIEGLLAETRSAYREGRSEEAADLAAEAYLDNYEVIEHEVEAADEELNEEVEELLGTELRAAIRAGDDAEVDALIAEAKGRLSAVERALEDE